MEESVTYRAIVEEGRAKGVLEGRKQGTILTLRKMLLLQGREHFGRAPGARIKKAIEAIDDPNELERLVVRVLHVRSWEELLSLPKRRKS